MRQWARTIFEFSKKVLAKYSRDKGPLFAAAISFFGMTSLLPMLLLGISVFGYFVGSDVARREVVQFVHQIIPVNTPELEANLERLNRQSGFLGVLGLAALVWAASQVFAILQQVMNVAFDVDQPPGLIRMRVAAFGMVVAAGALFWLSLGITSLLTAIRNFEVHLWGLNPQRLDTIWNLGSAFVTFVISVLGFMLIYRFLPTRSVDGPGPLVGGITAGLLFELAKYAFRWYVTHVANLDALYGSLGGIVAVVLWIYYVAVITVLCAEVVAVYSGLEGSVRGED